MHIEVSRLQKNYQGLRPLRIRSLTVGARERVSIAGLDAAAAEVLVNLLTGASLPDEGEVRIFGVNTAAIMTDTQWLASLDRFGIVTHRAILLEGSTVEQNLALPFTLQLDPIPEDVLRQIGVLAAEVGLSPDDLAARIGDASAGVRCRVHLARALALQPSIVLLEHATAPLPETAVAAFGADLTRVCEARGLALLALTEDAKFAETVAHRRLALKPATGELAPVARRGLFGRW